MTSMVTLPRGMPSTLTVEPEATHLASLALSSGMESIKSQIIHQWQRIDAFKPLLQHGIRPIDRALFYGPPGNGKTVASRWIAKELGCPLYRVRCEALMTSSFGGTEKNVSDVMDWLEKQSTAVVLWDECESLLPNRQGMNDDACSRAVISSMQIFWQRLDRWSSPQLFLLATNMVEKIDAALSSRVDLQIEFGPPTVQQSLDVLEYWCEVFHEYGSDEWGKRLRDRIESRTFPESFRMLWQSISSEVRQWVVSQ